MGNNDKGHDMMLDGATGMKDMELSSEKGSARLGGNLLGAAESIDGLSNNLLMDTHFDD